MHVYDVSNPLAPNQVGHLEVGGYAKDVAVAGDYVCMAVGNVGGLFIIEVRDPANPRLAGALKGTATAVAVSGKFAYADFSSNNQSGFHVIDISDPTQPKVVGMAERTDSAWSMAVAGNRVFAGCWQSLQVFDVSDPAHPRRVEALNVGYLARKVAVQSDRLFVSAEKELTLFDLTTPEKLVRLGGYSFPSGATTGMAVQGEHVFLSRSGVGFVAMNIADPARPSEVSLFDTMPGPVAISSGHAFLASRGLQAVNIDQPATLRPVGNFDASGSAYRVSVSANLAYLVEANLWDFATRTFRNRLQVLDVSDPSSPTRIGGVDSKAEPNNVVVAGNYAYVTESILENTDGQQQYRSQFSVIDLSRSEQPTTVSTYAPDDGSVENLIIVGTIGYYSLKDVGLAILDLTIPESPRRVGTFNLPGISGPGVASGNRLFLTGWWMEDATRKSGLRVLDISNPTAPRLIGSYITDGLPQQVVLSGHFAFLAKSAELRDLGPIPGAPGPGPMIPFGGGLDIIDFSNPAQPTRVSQIYEPEAGPMGQGFTSVAVIGNRAYAASANHGLKAYDVSNPASPRLIEDFSPTGSGVREVVRAGNQLYVVAGYKGLLILGTPPWAFAQESHTVDEAAGEARVNVLRNALGESASKVRYRTREGSGKAGMDFVASEGTLTFAPNAGTAAITIPILNDALMGEAIAFFVDLLDRDGKAFATATINVRDNDTGFKFTSDGATLDEGKGVVTITVRRGTDLREPVSVEFAAHDGTAVAGQDYSAVSGILTFGPDEAEKTITINLMDDAVQEHVETFSLRLTNPSPSTSLGSPISAVITLEDNEPLLRFDMDQVTAREDQTFVQLTVVRDGATKSLATVGFSTRDASALAGSDYAALAGTLTFAPEETRVSIIVPLFGDIDAEQSETFQVVLSNPTGAGLASPSVATVTIQDDEPVLRLGIDQLDVPEDTTFVLIHVIRDGAAWSKVTVDYATRDGSAHAGSDYAAQTGTLTFGPGEIGKPIIIPVLDDLEGEQSETFRVILSNPSGGLDWPCPLSPHSPFRMMSP